MGEPKDSLMLLISVFVVIGITYFQERKTERTLEALKELSSPQATVIRDNQQIKIPAREVVVGDIVVIKEGDRVPADCTIVFCQNLLVDESLLTGESISVRKAEWDGKLIQQKPGGDDLPFVFSGTLVVSGRGFAKVTNTGVSTEIGKIGKSLDVIKDEVTLLRQEINKIVQFFVRMGLILCILVVIIYVVVNKSLIEGLLGGLTLSMAILPEEFPVVLLIFFTLGAWRISKKNVLTRKSAAIETLGAATVLCTDKTGTLTLNKMELTSLYSQESFFELEDVISSEIPSKFQDILKYSFLSSQLQPFDPIEKEIAKNAKLYLPSLQLQVDNSKLIREYSLSKELLAMTQVWQQSDNHDYLVASKGAPEAIIDLCHLSTLEKNKIIKAVSTMSERGLRVLGVAKAESSQDLSEKQHDFNFIFVGLIGFVDPVRQTAPEAISEAYGAGIRVIIVTGDYRGTAQYVAKKIGLKNSDEYILGEELTHMSLETLRDRIKTVNIFARVAPEQKLMIVEALKANGEIVAMTGDGVNDAPALKSANIGIAMGERGTDVAREAASLVLLDDNFSSIVAAVRLGRRIYDNLKRAMGYILTVHIPIAGMSLLPIIFGYPLVLLPAHVAFLELIIDPACSTVFESEEEDPSIMSRPPRDLRRPIFTKKVFVISILQGLGVLLASFGLLSWSQSTGFSELESRSFAFVTLVLSNLLLIIVNLSWSKNIFEILFSFNKILLLVIALATISLISVLYLPFLSVLFRITPLSGSNYLIIIFTTFVSLVWFEAWKYLRVRV